MSAHQPRPGKTKTRIPHVQTCRGQLSTRRERSVHCHRRHRAHDRRRSRRRQMDKVRPHTRRKQTRDRRDYSPPVARVSRCTDEQRAMTSVAHHSGTSEKQSTSRRRNDTAAVVPPKLDRAVAPFARASLISGRRSDRYAWEDRHCGKEEVEKENAKRRRKKRSERA